MTGWREQVALVTGGARFSSLMRRISPLGDAFAPNLPIAQAAVLAGRLNVPRAKKLSYVMSIIFYALTAE
jgi:hypothetical protein